MFFKLSNRPKKNQDFAFSLCVRKKCSLFVSSSHLFHDKLRHSVGITRKKHSSTSIPVVATWAVAVASAAGPKPHLPGLIPPGSFFLTSKGNFSSLYTFYSVPIQGSAFALLKFSFPLTPWPTRWDFGGRGSYLYVLFYSFYYLNISAHTI